MNEQPPGKSGMNGNGFNLKTLNWPTVILIIVTGGGNWLATNKNSTAIDYNRQKVFDQIQDLHNALGAFEQRQGTILSNQSSMLKNQTVMLDNQAKMLTELQQFPR